MRAFRKGGLILALVLVAGIGGIDRTDPAHARPEMTEANGNSTDPGSVSTVTLITGDRVHVREVYDGPAVLGVDPASRHNGIVPQFHVAAYDGELRVTPTDVQTLVGTTLDPELFNVTSLMEQGFDDGSRSTLPVIVTFSGGPEVARRRAQLPAAAQTRELSIVDAVAVELDRDDATELTAALTDLAAAGITPQPDDAQAGPLADVERIWLDRKVAVQLDHSTGQIGAPRGWDLGLDGSGVRIAVLDTGIDDEHPDLAGQIVAEQNFTDDPTVDDRHGHGTHVASIVGGRGTASGGSRQGVAPGAELVNGKVLDSEGAGLTSGIIAGMEWAVVEAGADILNMSLGTSAEHPDAELLERAVETLTADHGALVVAAAGNDGCECILAPGDAPSALTVGAVDRADQLADFSSRGPTIRTSSLKPDLVAPGVDIVAARHTGSGGSDPYVAFSGTSMATPHVAGAAALLAQAQPVLTAGELKAALMSAAMPIPGPTPYEVGAGRVDLERVVDSPVVAGVGSVDFGSFSYPYHDLDPVSATVTYRNLSDHPVTLQLSTEASEVIHVQPRDLAIPAGETAAADVVLDVANSPAGRFTGRVLAEVDEEVVVRTPLAYFVEEQTFELRIEALARDGRSTVPVMYGVVDVETGAHFPALFCDDADLVAACSQVPEGTYSAMGYVSTMPSWWTSEAGYSPPLHTTLVGEPEIVVASDTTITLDARNADEISVEIPADETKVNVGGAFHLTWSRTPQESSEPVGESIMNAPGSQLEERLFGLPTEEVTIGDLDITSRWLLEVPEVTMRMGEHVELNPQYYPMTQFSDNSWEFPRMQGEHELPVVDAGEGRPTDFEGLELDGALALIRRTDGMAVADQANRAAEAGATMVVVYNDQPGHNASTGGFGVRLQVPTVRLSHEDGTAVLDRLGSGPASIEVVGRPVSPYRYDLVFAEHGRVPPDMDYVSRPDELVRIDRHFHDLGGDDRGHSESSYAYQPWDPYTITHSRPLVGAPRHRTDYRVWHPDTQWGDLLTTPEVPFNGSSGPHRFLELGSPRVTHSKGERRHMSVLEAPLTVGLNPGYSVNRTGDTLHISGGPNAPSDAQSIGVVDAQHNFAAVTSPLFGDDGFTTRFRLWSGDEVLSDTPHSPGAPDGYVQLPRKDRTRYGMSFHVANPMPWTELGTRMTTEWSFFSEHVDSPAPQPVPLLTVTYSLDVDLRNQLPSPPERRGPNAVEIEVGHQAGVEIPVAGMEFEVSYDDGTAWRKVRSIKSGDGRYRVNLGGKFPKGAEFISFRVSAEDARGNTVDQEIIRAVRR